MRLVLCRFCTLHSPPVFGLRVKVVSADVLYVKRIQKNQTYLRVQEDQGGSNLQGQAPELVQALAQVDDAIRVHRHQRLHLPARECGHVRRAQHERLIEDDAGQRAPQLAGDAALQVAVLAVQDGLQCEQVALRRGSRLETPAFLHLHVRGRMLLPLTWQD